MSEMLGQIIEPYIADAETLDAYHKLVSIGAIAWNNTLLPPEGQAEGFAIADKLEMSAEDKEIMNELIIALMKRKINLFPEIHRFIVDFEVSDMGNQWHLSVASTMPPGES